MTNQAFPMARLGLSLSIGLLLVLAGGPADAQNQRKVDMYDDCDEEDYTTRFGPGVCVGKGHTTFSEFAQELVATGEVDTWRFQYPNGTHVDENGVLVIENRGGLLHTFTRVEEFGGGSQAAFNNAAGTPEPAPECATVLPDGSLMATPPNDTNLFIGAAGFGFMVTGANGVLPAGEHHFQCCVHPWMRMTIEVEEE